MRYLDFEVEHADLPDEDYFKAKKEWRKKSLILHLEDWLTKKLQERIIGIVLRRRKK